MNSTTNTQMAIIKSSPTTSAESEFRSSCSGRPLGRPSGRDALDAELVIVLIPSTRQMRALKTEVEGMCVSVEDIWADQDPGTGTLIEAENYALLADY